MNSVQLNLTEFYSNIELLDDDNRRVFIKNNINYLSPTDRLEVYTKYKDFFNY